MKLTVQALVFRESVLHDHKLNSPSKHLLNQTVQFLCVIHCFAMLNYACQKNSNIHFESRQNFTIQYCFNFKHLNQKHFQLKLNTCVCQRNDHACHNKIMLLNTFKITDSWYCWPTSKDWLRQCLFSHY